MSAVELPEGWVLTELGLLLDNMVGGASPTKDDYTENGTLALNKGDIKPNGIVTLKKTPKRLPQSFCEHHKDKIISSGSILVTLRDLSQKADFLGLISLYNNNEEALITQGMYSLESKYIHHKLLVLFSNSHNYREYVKREKIGATQIHLRNEQFKKTPIPLPPLAEQKVIADKLDTLLAQVENTKARFERIPDILKRYRQSVLTAAVSGKLTEGWREENGIDLESWVSGQLEQFIEKPTYGSSAKSQNEGLIPVLRMGNIQNGKLDWDNLVYTSNADEIEKFNLNTGDLLFNRTNSPELVGKTAIYQGEQKAIYAGYLIKIKCKSMLLPEFLNYHLNSPSAKDYCMMVKSDGVSQSNINAQKLKAYPISVPSIEEQQAIINFIRSFFEYVDNIEKNTKKTLEHTVNLTQSILAKAFRGELTADWRAANPDLISGDNSAEALLEKIKAERETMKPVKKARKKKV